MSIAYYRSAVATAVFVVSAVAVSSFSEKLIAAEPLKVGVVIPGSITDKGWMESGYDGIKAAEQKYGDRIKVQLIENIKDADMVQAITKSRPTQ